MTSSIQAADGDCDSPVTQEPDSDAGEGNGETVPVQANTDSSASASKTSAHDIATANIPHTAANENIPASEKPAEEDTVAEDIAADGAAAEDASGENVAAKGAAAEDTATEDAATEDAAAQPHGEDTAPREAVTADTPHADTLATIEEAPSAVPEAEPAIAETPGTATELASAEPEAAPSPAVPEAAPASATATPSEPASQTQLPPFGTSPLAMMAAFDGASVAAAKLAFKIMEFAQASMQSNLELACDCVAVRSLPEALDLHTAYIHRQFQLLTTQIGELHAITATMAFSPADTAHRTKSDAD